MVKRTVLLSVLFVLWLTSLGQDTTQVADTHNRYTPYIMHTFGVHIRARYAYMMEYNVRPFPHAEIKLEGGTADHTHYNLMGFSTTKTTGRYLGIGISILSNNYYKPVDSYKLQKSIIGSFSAGLGSLNFVGNQTFASSLFPDHNIEIQEEGIDYVYFETRLGFEIILDRVVRFDVYPLQFTWSNITSDSKLNHQYIPAIGITRNGIYNPGLGVHIAINQIRKKE